MKVNFEFNFEELDNNELRINGRRTVSVNSSLKTILPIHHAF